MLQPKQQRATDWMQIWESNCVLCLTYLVPVECPNQGSWTLSELFITCYFLLQFFLQSGNCLFPSVAFTYINYPVLQPNKEAAGYTGNTSQMNHTVKQPSRYHIWIHPGCSRNAVSSVLPALIRCKFVKLPRHCLENQNTSLLI